VLVAKYELKVVATRVVRDVRERSGTELKIHWEVANEVHTILKKWDAGSLAFQIDGSNHVGTSVMIEHGSARRRQVDAEA
jgi:hypothetical protein